MTDLFTQAQRDQLRANSIDQDNGNDIDRVPVVKLFTPGEGRCTWLLTELDANNVAFGLCDLGMGEPELGYVDINEMLDAINRIGLPIERDLYVTLDKPLSHYTELARKARRIVT